LSRHRHDFDAVEGREAELEELLGSARRDVFEARDRQAAMACFLSQADGWRAASESLGGAFAALGRRGPRLSGGKEE